MKPTVSIADDGAIVIRGLRATVAAPDEAIPFPYGLERAAARQLEREGRIATAKIGRRRYARRSAVLAAIDAIAAEQSTQHATVKPKPDDTTGSYLALVGGSKR